MQKPADRRWSRGGKIYGMNDGVHSWSRWFRLNGFTHTIHRLVDSAVRLGFRLSGKALKTKKIPGGKVRRRVLEN
ncbi:MAG: hypothetical protein ACJASX_002105 [Limisphaerales bacterium]|jgi:hypothetical protein